MMAKFPSCKICDKQFTLKGPVPFLLPCLHAVCETCVTSAAAGVISCSPCQKDVNLTETRLQKDEVREREILLLTVQHHPELVLCTHEENGNQAVCWCKDCEEFLCEHCQMVHNSFKGTKKHMVHDIGELEAGDFEEETNCTVHPKFIVDTMDEDCKKLTCLKCRRKEHSGHKVVLVEQIADLAKTKLTKLQKDVKCTIKKHGLYLATTERALKSSDEAYRMLPDKICNTFHLLRSLLDQREKELQIELQLHKEKVEEVRDKKNISENCLQRCKTVSDYITKTLQYSSVHGILRHTPKLEKISLDCISAAPSDDNRPFPLPVFNTAGLDMFKSTIGCFGTIVTDVSVNRTTAEGANGREKRQEEASEKEVLKQKSDRIGELEATVERLRCQLEDNETEAEKRMILDEALLVNMQASISRLISERDEIHEVFAEKLKCLAELNQQEIYMTTYILDKRYLLQRTPISFDKSKVNTQKVTLTADDELVNTITSNPATSAHNFSKYFGTASNKPLFLNDSYVYFEVKTITTIDKALTGNKLILEVGLVHKEDQDKHHCVDLLPEAYSLSVSHCSVHDSICRRIWKHGNRVLCLPGTLANKVGSSSTLHFGVASDAKMGRVAFLDVETMTQIAVLDNVDFSNCLWPMFGVYCHDSANVKMTLVTGRDISMSDEKTTLLFNFISS